MVARVEKIRRIHLVLTSRCNLRCAYCYQDRKAPGRMKWKTLRAALDLGLASKRPTIGFTFYGGEPLLEMPLIRRSVQYVGAHLPPGRAAEFSVITNGTLITSDVARYLSRHRFRLRLSFDGLPEAQDLRGRGTFARLDRLLERLRRDHPRWFRERVTVTAVLTPETVRFFAGSMSYLLDKGVTGISVIPTIAPTPSWRKGRIIELSEQCDLIHRRSLERWRRTGEIPLFFMRPRAQPEEALPAHISFCGAARGETLTVDTDGEVLGCGMLSTSLQRFPAHAVQERIESMRIGPVDAPRLGERLAAFPEAARRSGIFDDKQVKRSSYGRCAKCRFLVRCTICPISLAKQGVENREAISDAIPDFACAFQRVILLWQDRFAERIRREGLDFRRPAPGAIRVRRLAGLRWPQMGHATSTFRASSEALRSEDGGTAAPRQDQPAAMQGSARRGTREGT